MRPLALTLPLALASGFSTTASRAHEPNPELVSHEVIDGHFDAADWTFGVLSGTAGGAVGAVLGGSLGLALAGTCEEDPNTSGLFGDCFLHGVGETMIGATFGATFGGAAGIYAYGESSGHRGSYWAAAGGYTLGLAGAAGIGALFADSDAGSALTWVALLTLPALGGTAGYALSLEDGTPDYAPPPVGGLFEVNNDTLNLGVPNVAVTLDPLGELERVDLTLVGGRF
jgi:hypothetical protein